MGLSGYLQSVDSHSPVSSEFRVRTWHGALMSILTVVVIVYLTYTEFVFNFANEVLDHVRVNATSPDGLEMDFDITFPGLPCALISIDANDPTGQTQSLHIDREHRVYKHRLNKNGELIGRKSKFEIGGTLQSEATLRELADEMGFEDDEGGIVTANDGNQTTDDSKDDEDECGSCYGAGDKGECCNTCDDVKRVYQRKGWHIDLSLVKECKHQAMIKDEEGEGCNVHGTVALSTGGGNLHVAPGRGLEKFGRENKDDFMTTLTEFLTQTFEAFNVSHTINRVRFGEEYPGDIHQLDGQSRTVVDASGMYQYYIQVVPTVYRFLNGTVIRTNQYSVTEHLRHVTPGTGRGLPGVFFFYEVSPLHVEMEEYRRGWVRFLTSVCAIVGGVFTVMGMADQYVFSRTVEGTLG